MIRKPIWAGERKFYPADPQLLKTEIEKYIEPEKEKVNAKAVVMPHAGYIFSGSVAGKTISEVTVPNHIILLGPNHTGLGASYAMVSKGAWITPFGEIKINENLAGLLLKNSKFIEEDESAHINEHCIEVELPFLQYFNKDISIVPIVIRDFSYENFEKVGHEVAESIKEFSKPVLIVASSDMTHYEPHAEIKEKDFSAVDAIVNLDAKELLLRVYIKKISMCGFAPVCVAICASKELGATTGKLVDYQTSGDASGEYSSVVGYAGITIT